MATIVDIDMNRKRREELQAIEMIPDKNIMEQIYCDPMAILDDDKFLFEHVINNGYHSSCLVEALGLEQLEFDATNPETGEVEHHKMFVSKNLPYTHYDMMFKTEAYLKTQRQHIAPLINPAELINQLEIKPLPKSKFDPLKHR